MTSTAPANAEMLMDRFVSASSVQDAVESLQGILDGFKKSSTDEEPWQSSWIWQHEDYSEHLVHLLQHGTLKSCSDLPCEDGVNLALQLYQQPPFLVSASKEALLQPAPGRLLEALLDVMDHAERPIYTRVLALQVLEQLSKKPANASTVSQQWLQAPNGLHRLADLLTLGEDNPMEEVVRNQALLVAHLLAQHAPIAKVFLFAEVDVKLLDLCWAQGGLTKGNPIVLDALRLIRELCKHADGALQDLVWQRPNVAPRLAQLLDLRGGHEFLHPDEERKSSKTKPVQKPTLTITQRANQTAADDDDLDSLLQSGDTTKQKDQLSSSSSKTKNDDPAEQDNSNADLPHLLPSEEDIVSSVLEILHLLLESESLRPTVWRQHAGLCSLVWELALIHPAHPPVCALPSAKLQQAALELVAQKLVDPVTMDRHSGLDRLLYLVCTGGGTATTVDERLGLSQAALAVLRQVLDADRIHQILLHTLAPPPQDAEEEKDAGPTVVQKLWNTVAASPTNQMRRLRRTNAPCSCREPWVVWP
jgi:hypothetical protein